ASGTGGSARPGFSGGRKTGCGRSPRFLLVRRWAGRPAAPPRNSGRPAGHGRRISKKPADGVSARGGENRAGEPSRRGESRRQSAANSSAGGSISKLQAVLLQMGQNETFVRRRRDQGGSVWFPANTEPGAPAGFQPVTTGDKRRRLAEPHE